MEAFRCGRAFRRRDSSCVSNAGVQTDAWPRFASARVALVWAPRATEQCLVSVGWLHL